MEEEEAKEFKYEESKLPSIESDFVDDFHSERDLNLSKEEGRHRFMATKIHRLLEIMLERLLTKD